MNLFENLEKMLNNNKNIENKDIEKEVTINADNLSQDEVELANKLDAVESYTVDRVEDDIVVLENRTTKEMFDLEKDNLPEGIKTGDILKKINGKYFVDELETKDVAERIQKKMDDLWN